MWGIYALSVGIASFFLWIIIVIYVALALAEISGLGSVNPRTQLVCHSFMNILKIAKKIQVDPASLRDIVPWGATLDDICCCGSDAWPIYDETSEREAIIQDRQALIALEEGKSLREMDLTASSNISLFLPSLRDLRKFGTDTSGVENNNNLKR